MTEPADHLTLAGEFPAATREQWLKLVDAVLKGAPFEKKLVSRSYDGLPIAPLYPRAGAAQPLTGRAPGAPWELMQRIELPDPAAANAEVLHDLENGAIGLTLVLAGSTGDHGYGLVPSREAIARTLDGVYLDGISIDLQLPPFAPQATADLAALVKQRGIAPATTRIRFGLDPIAAMAATGRSPLPWSDLAKRFTGAVGELCGQGFAGPFAAADGRIVHDAGGSEAQELAFALASALAYLRALEASGVALDSARRMIYFRLTADADQFLTVAKFRALRKLWARVEEACGLAPAPTFVAAETAWRMMTRRDPYVNMLRATVAVFAAGIGGADSITVLPYTAALGLPDRFARRIARNTQLILLEESNLAKVADPTAGSGGIEELTLELCAAAWSLFQEIEKTGGAGQALEQGLIQSKVAAVRAAREAAVAKRKDALTGTTEFPNIAELPVSVLAAAPHPIAPSAASGVKFDPLHAGRLAAPFEALRDNSDRMLAQTGARPKVFLANLGPIAAFTTRAMFAKNFFEAGGIEAVSNDGFKDQAEMIAAFKASGAKLACLCSSNAVYAQAAAGAAKALTAAGARHIYLAGRPGEHEAAFKAAGVQSFIYAGCDVLATLKAAHDILAAAR